MTLIAGLQEFIGKKIFKNGAEFYGDVKLHQTVTGYSPVPSEPSLGSPHHHVPTADTYVYTNTSPAANTWYAVDVSGDVPGGAKAGFVFVTVANQASLIYTALSNSETVGIRNRNCVVASGGGAYVYVPLNSSRTFYIAVDNTTSDLYVGHMNDYFA